MAIETKILAGQEFGDVENLPIMHAEVLNHVEDSFKAGHSALNLDVVGVLKGHCLSFGKYSSDSFEGRVQALSQFRSRQGTLLSELGWPVAGDNRTTQRYYQPLLNVAVQMQQQIPNAVALRIGTPPDLLITQKIETLTNASPVLVEQFASAYIQEKTVSAIGHFFMLSAGFTGSGTKVRRSVSECATLDSTRFDCGAVVHG